MAIATLSSYLSELSSQRLMPILGLNNNPSGFVPVSYYANVRSLDGAVGSAPGAAATCTKSSTFAWNTNLPTYTAGTHILGAQLATGALQSAPCGGSILLIDRLSHQSGLDGTVTTAQTTNLPTAALPRSTSGVGVLAMLEIYTITGSTATTYTVSYTNHAGTSGCTSPAALFPASPNPNRVVFIPMASGDQGFRSVESVTLAGSTGTAGNFGVTLFRVVGVLGSSDGGAGGQYANDLTSQMPLGLPLIDDICLQGLSLYASSNVSAPNGNILYGVGA